MKKAEEHLQIELMKWFNLAYPEFSVVVSALRGGNIVLVRTSLFYHIPNGKQRDKITGGRLKMMGVSPGVPDLFFCLNNGENSGLYIELKSKLGKLSPEQIRFRNLVEKYTMIFPYKFVVVDEISYGIKVIQDYINVYRKNFKIFQK